METQSPPAKIPRSSDAETVTVAATPAPSVGLGLGLGSVFGNGKAAFTFLQLQELEHQALIFKYMMAGVPVPFHLVLPIWKSVVSSAGGVYRHHPSCTLNFHFFLALSSWVSLNFLLSGGLVAVICALTIETAWNQSREGAEEQMERNGDALRMWCRIKSTVSATCIEAVNVQESLWKAIPLPTTTPTPPKTPSIPTPISPFQSQAVSNS
ncbi:growth-regulating factor 6 isoform X2 [Magnolia sinica]|uniref:growth-regulating factor 6 isoform X2 n=1 Tax=Magnolia sinica TaxID=86752 RepID=UPI002658853D|nr:growth-regulating factor 6 isoform X2 [Magnolia sinica]